jgi:alcohol dehydrogenase
MKKVWEYHNPVKVISGVGSLSRLHEFTKSGDWLVVTSAGFTRRGIIDTLKKQLYDLTLHVYDGVTPNPELEDLEAVTQRYRSKPLNGIIALGGGSTIDAAKVLAVTLCSDLEQPLVEVLRLSKNYDWSIKLPLIVIPTTSGTGAEVTPFATVWDKPYHKKYSVTGDKVYPDIALLDSALTKSLPDFETLYTSLDAISHALESLWNVNRTPISEAFAAQSLTLALKALPKLRVQPNDLNARTNMQQASLLAGLAISQTRTAIAHSISYPLTSHFNVPHGIACSFTLPTLIDEYLKFKPEENNKELMLMSKELILSFNIAVYVKKYARKEDIISKKTEMYHPDRAGNFDGDMNEVKLQNIILKSLNLN